MAYYETEQDRIREAEIMRQALQIYPQLSSHTWVQRPKGKSGALYDFFGRSNNRVLLPDYYVDVKDLDAKKNYPNNIISVEKIEFMKANPQYEFYFIAYYPHLDKFRLRRIQEGQIEFVENFRFPHKRESQRLGKTFYKTQPVYFLNSPYYDVVHHIWQ